jgi:hypothetical protein
MNQRRRSKRKPLLRRLLRNRYSPGARWITLADVLLNAKEIWHCWKHRVPPGSSLRWSGDRITGHNTRRRD